MEVMGAPADEHLDEEEDDVDVGASFSWITISSVENFENERR